MKQKTHSGAKKRFKVTGGKRTVKVVGKKAAIRHRLTQKSKSQKNRARNAHHLADGDSKVIRKLLKV